MKTNKEIIEEFNEKVNELRRLVDIKDGEDSTTVSFGYKTCRKNAENNIDELFTVVDWGSIRDFLDKALASQKQEFKRVVEEMPWVRGIDPAHPRDGSRRGQVVLIDRKIILKLIENL